MRDRLLAFFDPNRSMAFFVVGTAALTVAVTVIYDTVKESLGLWGAWFLAFLLMVMATAAHHLPGCAPTGGRTAGASPSRPRVGPGWEIASRP